MQNLLRWLLEPVQNALLTLIVTADKIMLIAFTGFCMAPIWNEVCQLLIGHSSDAVGVGHLSRFKTVFMTTPSG